MPDTSVFVSLVRFIKHVIYTHMRDMSRCIAAYDKISIISGLYPTVLYTYLILSGYWHTILSGTVSVLAWNGSCRACVGSVQHIGSQYKKRYCSVLYFNYCYLTISFLYRIVIVYQRTVPIRYWYRLYVIRYRNNGKGAISEYCAKR